MGGGSNGIDGGGGGIEPAAAVAQIVNPANVMEPSDDQDSVALALMYVFDGPLPVPLNCVLPMVT